MTGSNILSLLSKSISVACVMTSTLMVSHTASADLFADDPEIGDSFGSSLAIGDFSGNGISDLAVGVSGEDIAPPLGTNSGAVHVFYSDNLIDNDHLLSSKCSWCNEGHSVATGDFNDDGFDDLAVGLPSADPNDVFYAGALKVYYGSKKGNGLYGNEADFTLGSSWGSFETIIGTPEPEDEWGSALAVGMFNDDNYHDLAISAPGRFVNGVPKAGAVWILYGSEFGLTTENNQMWHQNLSGIEGNSSDHGDFGRSLASGDFDGNGLDDLAIGSPGSNPSDVKEEFGVSDMGAIHVLYSDPNGLSATNNEQWHQDTALVKGKGEAGDRFGDSLAAGDFDNNNIDDIAIGVPGENLNSGVINVLYAKKGGLTSANNQIWSQKSKNIEGYSSPNEYFGSALTVGYFNQDEFADVAIGVPGNHSGLFVAGSQGAGSVNIIYGAAMGLMPDGNKEFSQNSPTIEDTAEVGDNFGASLAAGDMNGDGLDELAVGVSSEDYLGNNNAGVVHILTGDTAGLSTSYIFLHQD